MPAGPRGGILLCVHLLFLGSSGQLSQIVSHRPENVADQAPSRDDVILPFVGIAVKGHFDVGMARDGLYSFTSMPEEAASVM